MAGVTKIENIDVKARELDFVTRFGLNWEALQDILGITRAIKKEPGQTLKKKKVTVALEDGHVAEGAVIPYSQAHVTETPVEEMTLEKFAKAVSIEAIKEYGYDTAVAKTDEEFLHELQRNVTGRFYSYLRTGELTNVQNDFQLALAMATGLVINKFKAMGRTATEIVGFVNVLDVYKYLGTANITVQSAFGFNYIKDFMGYKTIFLLAEDEIPRGKVIATAVENIDLYYVDPSTSDFKKAGLDFTVQGETNLIGFHAQGNYGTAVSEAFALMGLTLFAEYIDAVAVVTIARVDAGTLGALTVASAAGANAGDTKITVSKASGAAGNALYFKSAATAPSVDYLEELDSTWTAWDGEADITAAGTKITIVEANGSKQALASGNATVTKA